MKIVCDANVIIDLAKIHRLDLLKSLFDEVIIPNEVKKELLAGGGEMKLQKCNHRFRAKTQRR